MLASWGLHVWHLFTISFTLNQTRAVKILSKRLLKESVKFKALKTLSFLFQCFLTFYLSMHSNKRKTKQKKCCSSQKVIEGLMKNNEFTSINISLGSDFADVVLCLPGRIGWPCCKTGSSTDISPPAWSLASHRCAGKENCSPEKRFSNRT